MINLNFIEIIEMPPSFEIFISSNLDIDFEIVGKYNIEINGLYQKTSVSFTPLKGFEEFQCNIENNRDLTKKYIQFIFFETLKNLNLGFDIQNISRRFKEEVQIIIDKKNKGDRVITFSPYYLKSNQSFGLLLNYKFHLREGEDYNIEAQKLSLSLDKNGRSNKEYYNDIFRILQWGLNKFILLFNNENQKGISLKNELTRLKESNLSKKEYLFSNSISNYSQFNGVRLNGPYAGLEGEAKFIFLFEDKFKDFSNTLYKSLNGNLFKGTFPGLKSMFGINLTSNNIKRVEIGKYDKEDIIEAHKKIVSLKQYQFSDNPTIVIFVEPSKEFNKDFSPYYLLKLLLTKSKIPVQVINYEKLGQKNGLKWSTSSIGLQIFSKLGGTPWIVKPSNHNCLILGIGSSHEKDEYGKIKKYFTYSVCLDSSGVYKKLAVLSKSENESNHLNDLKNNLISLLKSEEFADYKKCALHLPFKIKTKEIQFIKSALKEISNIEFKVIKVNLKNKFFGFSNHNTKVPYESIFIKLSYTEYLVWFEGLQYGKENILKKTGNPVHIEFLDNEDEIDLEKDRSYLQDVINLSGANWRGFNAKLMPISIYYSQIVADYTKEFEKFEEFNPDLFQYGLPWFL